MSKAYGDNIHMEGMTFSTSTGRLSGIIGPNGAGKTTLFRMITGKEKPDSGTFKIGETVKLAYVDQSRDDLDPKKTIWEIISDGLDVVQLGKRQVSSRLCCALQLLRQRSAKSFHAVRRRENRVHLAYA